jgi:O-antigen/teichoic acid export membrane protein
MKKEMLANNIASAGSIFWRIIVQLLMPPALIAWWGAERYGEWLYIASLPTLLSVADLGFADAAASQMTMEIAKGNRSEASRIFQSISAMTVVMCLILVGAGLPLLFFDQLKIGMAQFDKESLTAAFILVCYSSLLILSKLFLSCLRAGRHYAESTLIYDALQFLEGVGLLCAAYAGKSFVFCALVFISMRMINVIFLVGMILRRMSWLRWGLSSFEMKALRELLAPALAAMAMPVALALNFQGMIWIAGSSIGPAAAAVLATVRTASRVIIQIIGIFSRAAMPIYSASVAVNNKRSRDIIEQIDRLLTYFLLIPGCVAFGLFGRQLVSIWTRGNIDPPSVFVWLIAASALFHGLWVFRTNLLVSVNKHVRFGVALVFLTSVFTLLGLPSALLFGMNGVAADLVVLEFATFIAFVLLNNQFSSVRHRTSGTLS